MSQSEDRQSDPADRRKSAPGLTEMDTFVKSPAAAGITFGVSVVLFTMLGYALDRWLDMLPLFLLIGLAIGSVGGFIHLVEKVSPGTLFKSRRPTQADPQERQEEE